MRTPPILTRVNLHGRSHGLSGRRRQTTQGAWRDAVTHSALCRYGAGQFRRWLGQRRRNAGAARHHRHPRAGARVSSTATSRPICHSTCRSILTVVASMVACTATRARPMPMSICRRASTSRAGCLPSPMPPRCLRRELAKPGYRCESIALGGNTDVYQPIERKLGITRAIIEVLAECGHPFSIVTKSSLGRT
jgi:hypothetical protein